MKRPRLLCMAMVVCMFLVHTVSSYAAEELPLQVRSELGMQDGSKKVSLALTNASVKMFFDQIHAQTGMDFIYDSNLLKDFKVTISADNETLQSVLARVFGDAGYTYQIEGNIVTIQKRAEQKAKPQLLTGFVRDSEGEPLIGATVMIKGTTMGAIADVNGAYGIEVSEGQTLVFSSMGMEQKEFAYNGAQIIDVVLNDDPNRILDEVVITGIFNKAKESYTGSVSTVSKEKIEMYRGQNILQTLKNIDASINFAIDNINGSNPNTLPNINIRGNSSLPMSVEEYNEANRNNPNAPLIILDGFEISLEKLMDYNDDEIENINILKDASATAIYGSRGANGVIVVSTKRPVAGRLRVNAEAGITLEVPDLTSYDMLDAAEKLQVEKAAGLYDAPYSTSSAQELLYKQAYNERLKDVQSGVNTDWLAIPLQTGVGSRYNIRLEGGSNEFRWATSLQYKYTDGAMKGSSRRTFNGSITLMYEYKNLLFRNYTSIGNTHAHESKYGTFSDYVSQQPYNAPYDADGNLIRYFDPFYAWAAKPQNPLYDATLNSFDKSGSNDITNNFSIDWKILPELTLRGQLGISKSTSTSDHFLPAEHSYFTVDNVDEYSTDEGFMRRGLYRYSNGKSNSVNANVTLAYSKVFNDVHSLYVGADWSMMQSKYDGFNAAFEGFSNDAIVNIANARQYAENELPSGSNSKSRQFGVTANLNYIYSNRYYVDLSYRIDGSSAYGSDKKYAPFWSAGIGWNLHQEKWLNNSAVVSNLRLKASYGETGAASGAGMTDAYTYYTTITNNKYMNWMGSQLSGWGNPDLSWQKTDEFNAGVEFAFIDNRIRGSFEYYTKNTSNLLSSMDLPLDMGFPSYNANIGEVKNYGFEAALSAYLIRNRERDFSWMVSGQLVYNKNEITKLSDAIKAQNAAYLAQDEDADGNSVDIQNLFYEGDPQNAIYAVKSLGIDPSTGKEIFLDAEGNITSEWKASNKVFMGSAEPLYRGNASTMFQWKGLTLNVAFSYYWGGKTYNSTLRDRVEVTANSLMNSNADKRVLSSRWYKAGDVTFFKALSNTETRATSRYVMDNAVFQISSVNLQYKWNSEWLKKNARLNSVIFSVNMSDLFHFSTIKMERGLSYPFARNIQGSIKLLF